MIDRRENAIVEIENRILRDRQILNFKNFHRNFNDPSIFNSENMPGIYILEGDDIVKKHAERDVFGYPMWRLLELEIEIIVKIERDKGKSIKDFTKMVKKSIFCEKENEIYIAKNLETDNTFIREIKTIGPNIYNVPDLIGMKIIIGLNYMEQSLF